MNLCKAVTDVRKHAPRQDGFEHNRRELQPIGTVHRPVSITAFLVG